MRWIAVVALASTVVVLGACDLDLEDSPGSAGDEPAEPAAEPWEGPTDGTWERGSAAMRDVGFEEPYEGKISDYRITVVGLPELGPLEDDKVVVTGTFTVERFEERGYYDDGDVRSDNSFRFRAGNWSYPRHDEAYGTHPDVDCGQEELEVGESTTCRVSFRAVTDEIQNFYWGVNSGSLAAWPGQVVE